MPGPASGQLVAVEQSVELSASGGSLVTVEQTVGVYASGTLVTVEQDIVKRISASGSLIQVEQSIETKASGSLIIVSQRVKDANPPIPTNEEKYGWDLDVYINSVQVSPAELHGNVSITRREGQAALLDLTLIKSAGIQDLYQYHGKSITVDLVEVSKVSRIYTGIIDIPEVDLINGLITLRCTDKRKEQINSQFAHRVSSVGKWSSQIFDTPVDTADELTQRLKTTTTTVDFDAFGNYTVSDMMPKTTPDITLTDSDIFRRKPSISIASRGRLVNRVNLQYTYQYTRLRHRERPFELTGGTFCQVVGSNSEVYKFVRVQSVPDTINTTSYKLKPGTLTHEYLPDAGQYTCKNYFTGQYYTFTWTPFQTTGNTQAKLDSNGNPVLDAQGNQVYEYVNRTVTNYQKAWSTKTSWVGAKRFAQNITENINIEVNAPQSQSVYGVIEKDQKNGHRIEFDTSEFEQNDIYKAPDDNAIQIGSDWYYDEAGSPQEYLNGLATALNMAEATIAKSHRANVVSFETPIRSDIDLKHTLRVNANLIDATGKVVSVIHSFNISKRDATTSVETALSQSDSSPPSDTLIFDVLDAPLLGDTTSATIKIYASEAAEKGTGGSIGGSTNEVNEEFNVPGIDDLSRDEQTVDKYFTYSIPINHDNLTVTFQ